MGRGMPCGFYIAQLAFLVGVAASAVVVVLPYCLHGVREFGRLTIFGEFLAIPAVILATLFVFVDIGQPWRLANVFLALLELFTAIYSGSPEHIAPWVLLYWSVDGSVAPVVPFMWLSAALALASLIPVLQRRTYANPDRLIPVAAMVFVSIWIDKGAGMMTGGLNPSVPGRLTHYFPSWVEIVMGIGLYVLGALILAVLFKIAISVKREAGVGTGCH